MSSSDSGEGHVNLWRTAVMMPVMLIQTMMISVVRLSSPLLFARLPGGVYVAGAFLRTENRALTTPATLAPASGMRPIRPRR